MKGRHYDVIVLGTGIGALVAASLLARRDFSVLLLGQGRRDPTYRWGALPLRRRTFSLLGANSPALRRVLTELAQSQTFRRRTIALDPMLSVLMPGRRFEVPPDLALFEREVEREFPEVRRVVDELYATLAGVNEAADQAFSEDATWPPGTFWERRKATRLASDLPFLDAREGLLADFPQFHPYRAVVESTAAFATDLAGAPRTLSPFAMARLHAAWTRGVVTLGNGEDELLRFFVERILAHGGQVALHQSVERVVATRGGVESVVLEGDLGTTGCRFLLFSGAGEDLAALAGGEGLTARALREWPHVAKSSGRFVTSLVVRRELLPDPLGHESLVFGTPPSATPDPRRPIVRLQRIDEPNGAPPGVALLVAEILLPETGGLPRTDARAATLGTLRQYFPHLERHLLAVDSPHDGLSLWSYEGGRRIEIDRLKLTGASLRPEPMTPQYEIAAPSFHRLAAEPVRGPIERTFLVGPTVLPALGQEGELLAAISAARLVTKSDPRREKMRLEMWNRVEIG